MLYDALWPTPFILQELPQTLQEWLANPAIISLTHLVSGSQNESNHPTRVTWNGGKSVSSITKNSFRILVTTNGSFQIAPHGSGLGTNYAAWA